MCIWSRCRESGKRWATCPGRPKWDPKEEDRVRAEDKPRRCRITGIAKDTGLGLVPRVTSHTPQDEDQEEGADMGGGDAPEGPCESEVPERHRSGCDRGEARLNGPSLGPRSGLQLRSTSILERGRERVWRWCVEQDGKATYP